MMMSRSVNSRLTMSTSTTSDKCYFRMHTLLHTAHTFAHLKDLPLHEQFSFSILLPCCLHLPVVYCMGRGKEVGDPSPKHL